MDQNKAETSPHADTAHVSRAQPANRAPADTAQVPVEAPQATAEAAPVTAKPTGELVLPYSVVSRSDISKSLRELDSIDDFFHQSAIRGSKDQSLPTLGRVLDSLASSNNLNLLHAEDRATLKQFLTRLKAQVPIIHISFPSEPSGQFIGKLLEWFRAEVHPHTVLHIGLRPEIVAGCVVRTTNKYFDFSLRKRFDKSKEKLVESIMEISKNTKTAEVPVSEEEISTEPAGQAETDIETTVVENPEELVEAGGGA